MNHNHSRPGAFADWLRSPSPIRILLLILVGLGVLFPFVSRIPIGAPVATVYSVTRHAGIFRIDLSQEYESKNPVAKGEKGRILKISVPFREASGGCEFIYGAAVFTHATASATPAYYVNRTPRYLIRFRYDHLHERCESRDLTILSNDRPESVTVQLVRVSVSENVVSEIPDPVGVQIDLNQANMLHLRAVPRYIPLGEPFRDREETPRAPKFSSSVAQNNVEILFTPYDSIEDAILEGLDRRIKRCREEKRCDDVRLAVSILGSPAILQKLRLASDAGMNVDVMTNVGPRSWGTLNTGQSPLEMVPSPWSWLRGNYYFGSLKGFVPMHLKFIILGDDEVISNNSNYLFDWFYASRDMAFHYRSKEVAAMFREIFTMTRTALFYPLRVDTADPLQVLYTSRRPRGYSASSRTPYVRIVDELQHSTSAYGILFRRLADTGKKLVLDMAPLTDSCEWHEGKKSCFFDVLRDKARDGLLTLHLNLHFFIKEDFRYYRSASSISYSDRLILSSEAMRGNLQAMQELFPSGTGNISLHALAHEADSSHHLRAGILSPDSVIGGSANFAFPFTTNTIEIVRNRDLFVKAAQEFLTFNEPYYIVQVESQRRRKRFGRCEFVFERELLRDAPAAAREVPIRDIALEMRRKHGVSLSGGEEIVLPKWSEKIFTDRASSEEPTFNVSHLEGSVASPSSYLCIQKGGNTYVIKVPPSL